MNYLNQGYLNPYQYVQPMQPQSFLPYKVVDSIDVAKATDVPINSFGVFPKADLSEVYIKSWNNNGTTNIITFKPVNAEKQIDTSTQILEKINALELKIDKINKKTEVKTNDY